MAVIRFYRFIYFRQIWCVIILITYHIFRICNKIHDDFMAWITIIVCSFVTDAYNSLNPQTMESRTERCLWFNYHIGWLACNNVNVVYLCWVWAGYIHFLRYLILILTFWHLYLSIVVKRKKLLDENPADTQNGIKTLLCSRERVYFGVFVMSPSDEIRK